MVKLYFRYGTVGSAKTLNLLAVAHTYKQQEKSVLLLKPLIDDRFGKENITSRAGLSIQADYRISEKTVFSYQGESLTLVENLEENNLIDLDQNPLPACILVDECQFLAPQIIDQLWLITVRCQVPVILYGLRTNFKGFLFPGVKRIFERADVIEEIKTTCWFCNHKATHNLKISKGEPVLNGPEVELGLENMYKPSCKNCYLEKTYFFTGKDIHSFSKLEKS